MTRRRVEARPIGMVEVAYFLSKFGERKTGTSRMAPPAELGVTTWKDAYAAFYSRLGGHRTPSAFRNSLKNQRDTFDAFIEESGRQGWKQAGADQPIEHLTRRNKEVFERFSGMEREEVWSHVSQYVSYLPNATEENVADDLAAQDSACTDTSSKTEGGRKVYISYKAERDPKLRSAALNIHGFDCAACGFNFQQTYGQWGAGFAEVHHVVQLGGTNKGVRETDPTTDLVVLCANCHRMVHRKRKTVMSVDELKKMIARNHTVGLS